MSRNAYTGLGYVVWNGAKWYVKRRYLAPARKVAVGTLTVAAVGAAAFALWRATND